MKIGRALRADFKSSLTPFPPTVLLERSKEAVESRKVPFLEQGQNLRLVRVVPCRALVGRREQDQSHGHTYYQSRVSSHRFPFFLSTNWQRLLGLAPQFHCRLKSGGVT